jgi:signal transduction histidine kinase
LVSTPDDPATVAGAAPLSLVVDELLSNAFEHVEEPTVCVSLSVDGDEVVLRVADDGPGVTADSRAPLGSGAETPTEHGQGVGLWLVRWTVDAVGGTVHYEEETDGGAAVVARFPAVSDDAKG